MTDNCRSFRSSLPSISCLMVTKGDRFLLAKRSIECYLRQEYPRRNLLIVTDGCDGRDRSLRDYVSELRREDIIHLHVGDRTYALGELRNISVAAASGELCCQWDDDDLYHPQRLSLQAAPINAGRCSATFLTEQLQLISSTNSLYWCDWRNPRSEYPWPRAIPGTVMCERATGVRYPECGAEAQRSEDLEFMKSLLARCNGTLISGKGYLYMYVSHGANTWHEEHHLSIASCTALDRDALRLRKHTLDQEVAKYGLSVPLFVRDFRHELVYELESVAPSVAISTLHHARAVHH